MVASTANTAYDLHLAVAVIVLTTKHLCRAVRLQLNVLTALSLDQLNLCPRVCDKLLIENNNEWTVKLNKMIQCYKKCKPLQLVLLP